MILKEFDLKCHVNIYGDCKYWDVEKFGYAKGDTEAPLDKFFPEEVKTFLRESLASVIRWAAEEALPDPKTTGFEGEWTTAEAFDEGVKTSKEFLIKVADQIEKT